MKEGAHKLHRGFSLIELLVCVAILAVLASAALPIAEVKQRREREHELRLALREVRTAIDRYAQAVRQGKVAKRPDQSDYPASLDVLVSGVQRLDKPSETLYFLRRVPPDPMTKSNPAIHGQWALRSYRSAPDRPREGDDVFDVLSRSKEWGTNGVRYDQW